MLTVPKETEQLARAIAMRSGKPVETVLKEAVEAHAREAGVVAPDPTAPRTRIDMARVQAIIDRCASRPVLDERPADDILGYDEHGLPA